MIILSHRGYWIEEKEKNSIEAINRSLDHHWGFESDLRDFDKRLVISHNPATKDSINANTIWNLLKKHANQYCFAINIKSDGLSDLLLKELQSHHINNYFCFDMSVPQMIEYQEKGICFFTRLSEYEEKAVLLDAAAGIWIDAFKDYSWITTDLLSYYRNLGKKICIVSPELHNKPHLEFWNMLKSSGFSRSDLMLCTDLPAQAEGYFNEPIESGGQYE